MVPAGLLKEFAFFKGFNEEQLNKLSGLAIEHIFSAGSHVYKHSAPAEFLCLIKKGKIVLSIDNKTRPKEPPMQVTVDMISDGESIGWSSVVEPYKYSLSALCIVDAETITFNADSLRKSMDEDNMLGLKMMQAISQTIAARLMHTRTILVSERSGSVAPEASHEK
jgi:CRP-like cAMP-binding protein